MAVYTVLDVVVCIAIEEGDGLLEHATVARRYIRQQEVLVRVEVKLYRLAFLSKIVYCTLRALE